MSACGVGRLDDQQFWPDLLVQSVRLALLHRRESVGLQHVIRPRVIDRIEQDQQKNQGTQHVQRASGGGTGRVAQRAHTDFGTGDGLHTGRSMHQQATLFVHATRHPAAAIAQADLLRM